MGDNPKAAAAERAAAERGAKLAADVALYSTTDSTTVDAETSSNREGSVWDFLPVAKVGPRTRLSHHGIVMSDIRNPSNRCLLLQWEVRRLEVKSPDTAVRKCKAELLLLVELRHHGALLFAKFWIKDDNFFDKFVIIPFGGSFGTAPSLQLGHWYCTAVQEVIGAVRKYKTYDLFLRRALEEFFKMDPRLWTAPVLAPTNNWNNVEILRMNVIVVRRNPKGTIQYLEELFHCIPFGDVIALRPDIPLPYMSPDVYEETYEAVIEPLPKMVRLLHVGGPVCWQVVQVVKMIATVKWTEPGVFSDVHLREKIEANSLHVDRCQRKSASLDLLHKIGRRLHNRSHCGPADRDGLPQFALVEQKKSLVDCLECVKNHQTILLHTNDLIEFSKLLAIGELLQDDNESLEFRVSRGVYYFYQLLENPVYCSFLRICCTVLYDCIVSTLRYNRDHLAMNSEVDVVRLVELVPFYY